MANNFVNRGEVLTLTAMGNRESGGAYREYGFNGVALIDAAVNESFTFQVRGTFELALEGVKVGDLIFINAVTGQMHTILTGELAGNHLYGRAVTATDSDGNFHCMILQSE